MPLKIRVHERLNESAQYSVITKFSPDSPFELADKEYIFPGVDFNSLNKDFNTKEKAFAYARDISKMLASKNNSLEIEDVLDFKHPTMFINFTDTAVMDKLAKGVGATYYRVYKKEKGDRPACVAVISVKENAA